MRGFSLLEVMISLAIAMLLLITVAQLGIFVQQLWLQQEKNMNRIEALNVAYAWIARDIESAGYFGCLKQSLRQDKEDPLHLLLESEIEFFPSSMAVQYMSAETASLVSIVSPYQMEVTNNLHWKEGDLLVFEDCTVLAVDSIASVSQQGDYFLLTLTAPLMHKFSSDTRVGYLRQHQYQVKTTSRKNVQGKPITSLYVFDHYQWQELIEAIYSITWQHLGNKINIELTMMDGASLMIQAEQRNGL